MIYLLNLADQTRLFLLSLGFGFALGVLYDVFRVARLLIAPKRTRFYLLAQDIIYSVTCTVLSFYFFLVIGDGMLRSYSLGGLILGWLVYYFSLGVVALRSSEWLVRQLRRFSRAVVRVFAAPFLRLLHFLEKLANRARKIRIRTKFAKKNLHFGLQSTPNMVYNGVEKRLKKKKERHHLAKQPPRENYPAEKIRTPDQIGRAQTARRKPAGAGSGAGVRAFRGVPYFKHPRGHRHRGGAKRRAAAAVSPITGAEPGIPGSAE